MRERLPNRRRCETFQFDHGGLHFTATVGRYRDGRLGEIFISSNKPGSAIEALGQDASVAVSLALQFGCPIETIRHALLKDADGTAATLLGAALDIAGAS